ncbi:hypothetical protein EIP91_007521 [Steccherinum ochraceum]|uniref:O-methyltransferase C-terminal domain-containing protein n=1 Tax=Steccherinum ochraceum TaxID=92696 RepID=A0A4R0R496_9APHY|nr:hypothetical protein EIP91_007521 [Steccherinum ochraceum]
MSATSDLSALLRIITNGITAIESSCAKRGVHYPSLDDALTLDSVAIQESLVEEALPVIAAAYQVVATLMSPQSFQQKMLYGQTVAIGVAEAGHVAEILREAGPKGLHASEIAKHTTLDPRRLAHCLRILTTLHVFKETSPDVFTNNRVSAVLDTGKTVKEIVADPQAKYDGAPGLAALTGTNTDEFLKGAGHAVAMLTDPATSHSQEPVDSPLQRAFGKKMGLFDWYDLPENQFRLRRFGNAMRGVQWKASILGGFDWSALPQGSVVVDVGGGLGGLDLDLAKEHKHLKYIYQDRPQTVEQADKMWRDQGNQDVIDGIVKFQPHDFFGPQPVENAAVFLMRYILHDWSDPYCIKILSQLRASATPDTKLVVIDALLQNNCPSDGKWKHIRGGEAEIAPAPLLPNFGIAKSDEAYVDILLMSVTNTQERTLDEVNALFEATGWKLERVHRFPPPSIPQVVAVPA